jgi:hypothetical protein
MKRVSKWLGVFKDAKAYVKGSSKNKKVSHGEADTIADGKPDDAVLSEGESEGDRDASVNDEVESGRLAEATIISEETSRSDEGFDGEKASGGAENQTEILESDDIGSGLPVLKGLGKDSRRPLKFDIAAKRGIISGLFVGLLAMVFSHGAEMMNESPIVDEPEMLPVQMFLASIDGGKYDTLYFDRFLILLEGDDPAYLMLNIVITPSNKKTHEEVNAKRTICRGIIYEVLQKSVTKMAEFKEYRKTLEQEILEALNRVFATGAVEQVDLSEFLFV